MVEYFKYHKPVQTIYLIKSNYLVKTINLQCQLLVQFIIIKINQ